MLNRRKFLQTLSSLPIVGGMFGTTTIAAPNGRDYFKELGVGTFINAAGTYTMFTASLMRPEVMEAINYSSKHFVSLDRKSVV